MIKQNLKIRPGFTLVEVIVAFLALAMVILAAGVILVFGQNSFDEQLQQVNFQRDASCSIMRMKQAIRSARKAELEEEGNTVKIYNNSGWVKYKFVSDQKKLLYQFEGNNEQVLLDGVVESASFQIDPVNQNAVIVNLFLKNADYEVQLSSKTMMRNYGT
jgi:type II secretory pathway pseudopilin PulG